MFKPGRPSLEPFITDEHRELVKDYASIGKSCSAILKGLRDKGLEIKGEKAFKKYFKKEFQQGRKLLGTKLEESLFEKALSADPKHNNLLIFAMKTRYGWSSPDFKLNQNSDAIKQLEQLLKQVADGKIDASEAKNIAAIVELKEKATKGNLGESIAPSVVVNPFTHDDFEQTEQEIQAENEQSDIKGSE